MIRVAPATIATALSAGRHTTMLSFQKLDVYRCAIEFVAVAAQVAPQIPRGHAELRDELRRAALSVPLNIAEAAGRSSEADAARRYAIARRSAMECAAVLNVVRAALGSLQESQHRQVARTPCPGRCDADHAVPLTRR